jgi:hypothetical protein
MNDATIFAKMKIFAQTEFIILCIYFRKLNVNLKFINKIFTINMERKYSAPTSELFRSITSQKVLER